MRHLLRYLLLALALPFAAHGQPPSTGSEPVLSLSNGQVYPSKPIRVIIPFPPGNTIDIMTRLIAPKLAERLGHNVIVDNRAGASGQLGWSSQRAPRPTVTRGTFK